MLLPIQKLALFSFFFQFLIKTWSHHLDDKARTRYRQALLAFLACTKILCFLTLIYNVYLPQAVDT